MPQSRLGFRTSKTMASEEACKRGNAATLPYLRASIICGIIGIVVSVILMIGAAWMGFSRIPTAVPLLVLLAQLVIFGMAFSAANNAAAKV